MSRDRDCGDECDCRYKPVPPDWISVITSEELGGYEPGRVRLTLFGDVATYAMLTPDQARRIARELTTAAGATERKSALWRAHVDEPRGAGEPGGP